METSNRMGRNRTGIDMAPRLAKEMIRGAEELTEGGAIDGKSFDLARRELSAAMDEPVGSVPIPGTIKGALKSALEKVSGRNPEVLINKLGERLAFERTGVRLYQAAIAKCDAQASGAGATTLPPPERLRHFSDEEQQHFLLVKEAMESLGADPTAQTPDADVAGVASSGLLKAVTDPRTTVTQCLEALLTAELADHAGWELLIKLTDELGLDSITERFRRALREEEDHLRQVRGWLESSVLQQSS